MMYGQVIGVVPIVMSAGAAVLPTVLAALTGILAIILKPRELWRICRRHPLTAGITLGLLALVITTGGLLFSGSRSRTARGGALPANGGPVDWAGIAREIIASESAGPAAEHPLTAAAAGALYARCNTDGSAAPAGLKPLWHFQPANTMFLSRPVVFGKRIYAAGCQSDLGGYTGLLACLDADTGKPLWQITELHGDVLPPFFSSPALTPDGKYLVIGQGLHQDRDCSLLCFDTQTHALHWAVKTTLHIESSPAIFGDIAVVGAGAIEGANGKPTGDPGFVLAVRISDGRELWRQPVNDPESSPAVDEEGVVYIGSGFNGNAIVAIRSQSDDELKARGLSRLAWRRDVGLPVTGDMTLAGDMVVAGAGNGDFVHSNSNARGLVVALDKKTGAVRWQTPMSDSVLGSIAFREGLLICPSRSGEVAALSADKGQVLWRTRISGKAPLLAGCAFGGNFIYAVSSDGYLALLEPEKGGIGERLYLNDQAIPATSGLTGCPPQIAAGRVIAGSETGGLVCLTGTGKAP